MSSLDDVSTYVVCDVVGSNIKLSNKKVTSCAQKAEHEIEDGVSDNSGNIITSADIDTVSNDIAMDRQFAKKRNASSSRSSLLYTIYLLITCLLLIPSSTLATQVKWQPNNNIKPENQAAHNAPRSQKYWDENNIKRPDYAKTDAEVASERGESGGSGGSGGLFGLFLKVSIGIILLAIVYARITGDWDSILNNPVGSYITDCINWVLELIGMKGNRLGSSTEERTMPSTEARRLARLARFDNTKNMLDDMKAD